MEKRDTYQLILDEWVVSLPNRDRSNKSLKSNFEGLFESWKQAGASFSDLYDGLLKIAIKAHQPSTFVARKVYKSCKKAINNLDKSEKEFIEAWNKGIENTATSTFFEFFPSPVSAPKETQPASHGNMSAAEYRAQRRYADQFPVLDTSELEARWNDRQYNLDIEDMIKNVLGGQDEANSGTN